MMMIGSRRRRSRSRIIRMTTKRGGASQRVPGSAEQQRLTPCTPVTPSP